jgi:PPOX class probable F420-dependent enzyme
MPTMSDPSITEDTDALREQRREFVREHRTAVFGYRRRGHGPSMSIVYYVVAGDDELRVSSMRGRSKTKPVRRDGKVTLCVLDEQWPMSYLQVYCDAEVDEDVDGAVDQMMAISAIMAGEPMPESARPDVEAMCRREHRVVLKLRPYATFQTPPRHVHNAADLKGLTHWTSTSLPW